MKYIYAIFFLLFMIGIANALGTTAGNGNGTSNSPTTNLTITGGSINGTPIGATTSSTALFTTVTAGTVSMTTCLVGGVACATGAAGNGAEQTISYQPGLLSAVNSTKGVFGKFVKASTLDNIEGSAITFSCVSNPTVTLTNCHTDTSCATGPTAMGTVTLTASGTAFDGSISSAAILAGEYLAWSITAGTCASVDLAATAQIHAN